MKPLPLPLLPVAPAKPPFVEPLRAWPRPAALLAGLLLTGCAAVAPPSVVPPAAAPAAKPAPSSQPLTAAQGPLHRHSPQAEASKAGESAAKAPQPAPVAEATVVSVDALNPTARVDFDNAAAEADLWARVRSGMRMPDLDTELVQRWEQWYADRPDYVQRMTQRGGRYLFHIVNELERRNMPAELALLPFIESAFNPQALSSARASGMWQFIPGTGRDFDLKQNLFRDDRRDVLASTRAALDYLQLLHGKFGDWHLALAAYNWGQGNVQRAVARNEKAGLPTDYLSLRMPDETRNYVPKLQAVKNIVLRPEAFSLRLEPLKNHPYFISVALDRDIDVDRAAKLAGLPLDEFKALNPQMNKPVILAAGTPQVLLPYDNANQFVRALKQQRGSLATWTAWVAPRTMKPSQVAAEVGMDEDELRRVNTIPPRMLVKAGSTLLVPRSGTRHQDVAEAVADNAMLALAPDLPPMRRVSFRTGRKGESVAAAARRYGVSPVQLAAWNRTSANGRFAPGTNVVVLLPQRAAVLARAPAGKTKVARKESRPTTVMAKSGRAAPSMPRTAVARKPATRR